MMDERFEELCDFLSEHGVFFWDFYEDYPEKGQVLIDAKRVIYEEMNLYLPFYYDEQELIVRIVDEEY